MDGVIHFVIYNKPLIKPHATYYFILFQHMVGTGMATPFPAAAAAAAAAAQFAANGDALAGVKADASGPTPSSQPPLVKSEGPPTSTALSTNNFSPQPQSQHQNSIENQNSSVSTTTSA